MDKATYNVFLRENKLDPRQPMKIGLAYKTRKKSRVLIITEFKYDDPFVNFVVLVNLT